MKIVWHNEKRKISDLIPTENNPRILSEKQKKDLEKSINKFDLAEIPAINTNNKILAGHMRLKILKSLKGDIEIDVRVPNRELTEKEAQEYLIRSNKNTGEWDFDILANEFNEVELIDWGFEDFELGMGDVAEEEAKEDDYTIPDEIKTDIVKGDLFEIYKDGELRHKLLCGDSTILDDVKKLMGDEKADVVLTDPPYGIDIAKTGYIGGDKAFGKGIEKKDKKIKAKQYEKSDWDKERPDEAFFNILFNISNKQIIFGGNYFADIMPQSKHWIVWDKGVGEGTTFSKAELIYTNGFNRSNVELIKEQFSGLCGKEKERFHPTQKPIKLLSKIINQYIDKEDMILDVFLGSGSTMVASHQLNRRCYGLELSEKYCAVILQRMLKLDKDLIIKRDGIDENEKYGV